MKHKNTARHMVLFATPLAVVTTASIPASSHVWVQTAAIGFSIGLLIGAFLIWKLGRITQ